MTEFMCKRCFDSHSSRSPGGRVSRLLPFLPSPHLLLPLATILTLFSLSAPLSSDLFLKCACVCGWVLHCHEMLLALHAKQPALHLWPTLAQSVYFLWEWGMQTCRWRREARCLHRNTFKTAQRAISTRTCVRVCVWALQTHTKSAKKPYMFTQKWSKCSVYMQSCVQHAWLRIWIQQGECRSGGGLSFSVFLSVLC